MNGHEGEKGKSMSKTGRKTNSRNSKGRVQVGNLRQRDKELKDHEAKTVKGGAMGGVDYRRGPTPEIGRTTIGEEIPS